MQLTCFLCLLFTKHHGTKTENWFGFQSGPYVEDVYSVSVVQKHFELIMISVVLGISCPHHA